MIRNTPVAAEIIGRRQDSATIFSLDLVIPDQANFSFQPGQFNMLGCYGLGEVAISIASDPDDTSVLTHTIRAVGRVTRAMQALQIGDSLSLRGPFGRGWPLDRARGMDVVVVTGGLGCAPVVSVINYILARRSLFGQLSILQGVKHSDDFIYRQQYDRWQQAPDTRVMIAADQAGQHWPFKQGYVTDMLTSLQLNPLRTMVMMCGPEGMMLAAVNSLTRLGIPAENLYLSMERNMACGIGLCGHCQYGGLFICKDGPVLAWPQIADLYEEHGF